jgi:hypothetical protein
LTGSILPIKDYMPAIERSWISGYEEVGQLDSGHISNLRASPRSSAPYFLSRRRMHCLVEDKLQNEECIE